MERKNYEKNLMQIYDEFADWYDVFISFDDGYDPVLINHIHKEILMPRKVKTVIDCSCGTGHQSIGLLKYGYEVTSCDLNEKLLDKARENAVRFGVNLNAAQVGWDQLSTTFGVGKYDAVICAGNSLYHYADFGDRLTYLREIYSVLKEGGLCFIDSEWWDDEFHETDRHGNKRDRYKTYGDRRLNGRKIIPISLYEHEGREQKLTLYFIIDLDKPSKSPGSIFTGKYKAFTFKGYAFTIDELASLLYQAGFSTVQPVEAPGAWDLRAVIATK